MQALKETPMTSTVCSDAVVTVVLHKRLFLRIFLRMVGIEKWKLDPIDTARLLHRARALQMSGDFHVKTKWQRL